MHHLIKGIIDVTRWTHRELLETFRRLLNTHDSGLRFCFFIDGLDEYAGDHGELVELLEGMPSSSNIKFCVSSRPWNEFRNVWDQDSRRRLYLEELTGDDIRTYVRTKLECNKAFQEMQRESGGDKSVDCGELIREIVQKARGVFLWVFLVVRSLLRGLSNADSIADLHDRLRELPGELEPYFRHILNLIEDRYRVQMCQLFQVALAAQHHPMLLVTYSFLLYDASGDSSTVGNSIAGGDDYALMRMSERPLPDAVLTARLTRTRKRINARCRDLLDVSLRYGNDDFASWHVEFMHRSVRDFLELDETRTLLAERSTTAAAKGFNASLALYRALLATLKAIPPTLSIFMWDRWLVDLIEHAMAHAQLLDSARANNSNNGDSARERSRDKTERALLHSLYRSALVQGNRLEATFGVPPTHPLLRDCRATLIDFAVSYGLVAFVRQELDADPGLIARIVAKPDYAARILDNALCGRLRNLEAGSSVPREINLALLKLLLEGGVLPDSVWEGFLKYIAGFPSASPATKESWAAALTILIEHGAIPMHQGKTADESINNAVRTFRRVYSGRAHQRGLLTSLEALRPSCNTGETSSFDTIRHEKEVLSVVRAPGTSDEDEVDRNEATRFHEFAGSEETRMMMTICQHLDREAKTGVKGCRCTSEKAQLSNQTTERKSSFWNWLGYG